MASNMRLTPRQKELLGQIDEHKTGDSRYLAEAKRSLNLADDPVRATAEALIAIAEALEARRG